MPYSSSIAQNQDARICLAQSRFTGQVGRVCVAACGKMTIMSTKPIVLITRRIPTPLVDRIEAESTVRYWDSDDTMPRRELLAQAAGVAGIYCLITDRIDAEVLDAAGPSLRVVSTMSVGVDHIDVAACRARGVVVGHTPDVLTETTADLTLALMLATARRLPEALAAVKDGSWGTWHPFWMTGIDLYGSTVGIVGLGRIGVAVARRLHGFGCDILYTGRRPNEEHAAAAQASFRTLDELLAASDIVTLHCPLTAETRHLIDATALGKMKRSALLINTSRGPVVDQDALFAALVDGTIAGAGLDVTTPEPLPTDHPLLTLPNCVVLPHIGSATVATRQRMAAIAADNLVAGVLGRPLPCALAT